MTCDRTSHRAGNAFLYILIAAGLIGALSFVISKKNGSDPTGELSDSAAKAAANSIISYETRIKNTIDQMTQRGTGIGNIDFTLPSAASFDTAPTHARLFHRDGGGLPYTPLPAAYANYTLASPPNGYYVGRQNNFSQQTPSPAPDVIFSAYGISKKICAELNRKYTGSATIPAIPGSLAGYMTGTSNMSSAICPSCDDMPSLCVSNADASAFAYYSILVPR